MKVIHVPFCFHPDPVGCTEVYVEALARHLQNSGIEALVAAPGEKNESYLHNELRVRRFTSSKHIHDVSELYGEGDPLAAAKFGNIVDEERPDLVHLHAMTSAASLRLVRAVKSRQVPVVFTYHTPTVSCQRGTLMRWGKEICDGKLDVHLCARCSLHGLGLNRIAAHAVGSLSPAVGHWLRDHHLRGRVYTALRMAELVGLHHAAFRGMVAEVNHVVAVCNWVRDILLLNGVPPNKITLSRHGLCQDVDPPGRDTPPVTHGSDSALRIALVGRMHRTKGVHTIILAIRADPQLKATLDVYGVTQGVADERYQRTMRVLAADDPRISFHPPVPHGQVVGLLRKYDLLAVPSEWLETGPLVALEAFAAGIPVIGWKLGGVAELVTHDVNGLLVEPPFVSSWTEMLKKCCDDPEKIRRLRKGIRPPRKMAEVADEMAALYRNLISHQPAAMHPVA
jgi:glycosyltransferase involved in cell wall biosynthesis